MRFARPDILLNCSLKLTTGSFRQDPCISGGSPEITASLAYMLGLEPESLASLPIEINLQVIEVVEIVQPGATLIY
ncbi:MAG TPA: hypothetical protein P5102_06535 [Candidatus Competibacteraceae bacterium]|nr:hypothetical protein [Candidatus Competibacteraceae bacterium]HSA45649.1 hypothetical protein [Candidatus Competibacteraceae bacterium]